MIPQMTSVDVEAMIDQFHLRREIHKNILRLFQARNVHDFVQLSLGISDHSGNYSASEHSLGPMILSESTEDDVYRCAEAIYSCAGTHHLPETIYRQGVNYLKISVGSEMALMLKPNTHWVGNVRSVWAHLLVKHRGNLRRANEELSLYRDGERDSDMDYQIWRDLYLSLEASMKELYDLGAAAVSGRSIDFSEQRYLWSDAVANALYDGFADSSRR